jgi:hypothetical protein
MVRDWDRDAHFYRRRATALAGRDPADPLWNPGWDLGAVYQPRAYALMYVCETLLQSLDLAVHCPAGDHPIFWETVAGAVHKKRWTPDDPPAPAESVLSLAFDFNHHVLALEALVARQARETREAAVRCARAREERLESERRAARKAEYIRTGVGPGGPGGRSVRGKTKGRARGTRRGCGDPASAVDYPPLAAAAAAPPTPARVAFTPADIQRSIAETERTVKARRRRFMLLLCKYHPEGNPPLAEFFRRLRQNAAYQRHMLRGGAVVSHADPTAGRQFAVALEEIYALVPYDAFVAVRSHLLEKWAFTFREVLDALLIYALDPPLRCVRDASARLLKYCTQVGTALEKRLVVPVWCVRPMLEIRRLCNHPDKLYPTDVYILRHRCHSLHSLRPILTATPEEWREHITPYVGRTFTLADLPYPYRANVAPGGQ